MTISACRPPHLEQTSLSRQSTTGAVPGSHLDGVRLDLMLARLAPHDKPDLGSGSGTKRHRWAGLGFHIGGRLGEGDDQRDA
jgi:hypothetical protein